MPLAGETLTASVLSVGIPNGSPPVSTSSTGTAAAGSELFDIILGYYQFTVINGHRYEVHLNGLLISGSAVGDLYTIRIRDSGNSSAPTTGSTIVVTGQSYCAASGGSGTVSLAVCGSWVPAGSGVHTIGMSAQRVAGSGVVTPVGTRELFVVDLGGN